MQAGWLLCQGQEQKLVGVVIGLFLDFKCVCFVAFKARTVIGEVRSE